MSASNQRRRFDIDAGGRWLVAGDEARGLSLRWFRGWAIDRKDGWIIMTWTGWMTLILALISKLILVSYKLPRHGSYRWLAWIDTVSTAAFHPAQSVLMTVSGSRRFSAAQDINSEEEANSTSTDEGDSLSDESMGEVRQEVVVPRAKVTMIESTMKLWKA
jgi:hypothetical protein